MDLNQFYLAFVLDEATQRGLKALFPPKHSKVVCHHVTIAFNICEIDLEMVLADSDPDIRITGYGEVDGVEAFSVTYNGFKNRLDGKRYHITHSIEPPRKPVDSNLIQEFAPIKQRTLEAYDLPKLGGCIKLVKK